MITSAIIPAAGSGLRFGEKKQLKEINGKPLIYYTLLPFISSKMVDEIKNLQNSNNFVNLATEAPSRQVFCLIKNFHRGDLKILDP